MTDFCLDFPISINNVLNFVLFCSTRITFKKLKKSGIICNSGWRNNQFLSIQNLNVGHCKDVKSSEKCAHSTCCLPLIQICSPCVNVILRYTNIKCKSFFYECRKYIFYFPGELDGRSTEQNILLLGIYYIVIHIIHKNGSAWPLGPIWWYFVDTLYSFYNRCYTISEFLVMHKSL